MLLALHGEPGLHSESRNEIRMLTRRTVSQGPGLQLTTVAWPRRARRLRDGANDKLLSTQRRRAWPGPPATHRARASNQGGSGACCYPGPALKTPREPVARLTRIHATQPDPAPTSLETSKPNLE